MTFKKESKVSVAQISETVHTTQGLLPSFFTSQSSMGVAKAKVMNFQRVMPNTQQKLPQAVLSCEVKTIQ